MRIEFQTLNKAQKSNTRVLVTETNSHIAPLKVKMQKHIKSTMYQTWSWPTPPNNLTQKNTN